MELIDKRDHAKAEIITYRFSVIQKEKMTTDDPDAIRFRQIIPSVCASLVGLPFGLMLGWPSPTNPILIAKNSPIPITMDQSAMIAGFLMIGNAFGTPFCRKVCLRTKFGILLGITLITIGWILMWHSKSIHWLLGSRFLVGFGNAYAVGQLKIYISNTCDTDLKVILTKMVNLYSFLGIILIFSFGPFIDFRHTSITCLFLSLVVFFILLLLPTTPKELIQANKINQSSKFMSQLTRNVNINNEICKINKSIKDVSKEDGLLTLLRDKTVRITFLKFTLLVFFQQYSGSPATMIYTQILFKELNCPYPQYLAIAYAITFFICNVIGIFYMPTFHKRTVLLVSTASVILLIIVQILILYFKVNEIYWIYSSVFVLFLFIIVHTLGLGNIPVTLIPDLFPSSYNTCVTHFFVMFHSFLALSITKIFQVLLTQYNVATPFYLFLSISSFAFVFIYLFIRVNNKTEQSTNLYAVSIEEVNEIKNNVTN